MQENEILYLLRRVKEERRRADSCESTAARASHHDLAKRYELQLRRRSAGKVRIFPGK